MRQRIKSYTPGREKREYRSSLPAFVREEIQEEVSNKFWEDAHIEPSEIREIATRINARYQGCYLFNTILAHAEKCAAEVKHTAEW